MNKFLTAASLAAFLAAGGIAPAMAQEGAGAGTNDSGSTITRNGSDVPCPADAQDCVDESAEMDGTEATQTGSTGTMMETDTDSDGVADAAGNGIGSSSPDTESEPTGMSQ